MKIEQKQIESRIAALRIKDPDPSLWDGFTEYIESNIQDVCKTLDTRWLVSVCDTYADHGDEITRRNAMLVVQLVNFEKLWATYLLQYDLAENPEKLAMLKKNKVIPLWDGMYSFNINHGDMTNNLFNRQAELMKATPVIEAIYREVLKRIEANGTVLSNLNEYHKRLFEPYPRRSLLRIIRKRIRMFFKSYKI